MTWVLRCQEVGAKAAAELGAVGITAAPIGKFFKDVGLGDWPDDPAKPMELLQALFTDDPAQAKHFADPGIALVWWRQVDPIAPFRADGKPHRPRTAFWAMPVKLDDEP